MKLNITEVEYRSREAMAELIGLFWQSVPAQRGSLVLPEHDKESWLRLFDQAVGIPPRTLRPGLQAILALADHPHSIEALESMGAVRVTGNRVAFHLLGGPRPEPPLPHPDSWSLAFCQPLEADAQLVAKVFRTTHRGTNTIVASFPILEDTEEELALLLRHATANRSGLELLALWHKAGAIRRQLDFVKRLARNLRERLISLLSDILRRSHVEVSLDTDLAHEGFATQHPVQRELRIPKGRYGECAQADVVLGYSPGEIETSYYEEVIFSFCAGAGAADVANLVTNCPPGRVLHAAEHFIAIHGQESIPSLCHHPAWAVLGSRILDNLQVRVSRSRAGDVSLDLSEEKLRLQKMARRLLIAEPRVPPAEALAASIRVEQLAGVPRTYARRELHLVLDDLLPFWTERLANEAEPQRCAAALVDYLELEGSPTDDDLVVAFRLAAVIGNENQEAGRTAATAAAKAYTQRISSDDARWTRVSSNPDRLAGTVAGAISLVRPGEAWQELLRPFDPTEQCQLAKADETTERTTISSDPVPWIDHGRVFSGHGDLLIHLAENAGDDVLEEVLGAFFELYSADRRSSLQLPAFNHFGRRSPATALGQVDESLATLGSLLGRSTNGQTLARTLVRLDPDPFVLGSVAVGLTDADLRAQVLDHVKDLARTRIDSGMALGEALDLSAVLLQAGCPADAEGMATEAIRIAEAIRNSRGVPFVARAKVLLVGALADQKRWDDVLSVQVDNHYADEQRHVLNFHAVALLETERSSDAEQVLANILKRAPNNPMALANKTYALLRQEKWEETLLAVEDAKQRLGDALPAVVTANEQAARDGRDGKVPDSPSGHLVDPPRLPPPTVLPPNAVVVQFNAPVYVGEGATLSGTIAVAVSQAEYDAQLGRVESEITRSRERLDAMEEGMSEALLQVLRMMRDIQVDGASTAGMLAGMKATLDDLAASEFGRSLGNAGMAKAASLLESFAVSVGANLLTTALTQSFGG